MNAQASLPTDQELERRGRYKRAYDLTALAIAHLFPPLPLLWVVLWTLIPIMIWVEDRGPIFYGQKRMGKGGKTFTVLKFRTMVPDAERMTGPVLSVENDPRVTRVGRWLRATALDELPQVLNILRGDMSFVGPRAERPEIHARYVQREPLFAERIRVRPGLTGIAQIKGSYDLPPEKKIQFDLEYMRNMGPWVDTKLMLLSLRNTILRRWDKKEY
jgi:lipopolysaccharide/colanic/teichoic acid biosynthesis glycosyltransferase